jgi:hypothetical protein
MPISNTIDQDTGIIFENWTGDIRAPDLRAYWEHILTDPDVMARRRTLVDLRRARIHFTGQELANLVAAVVIPALKGLHWITAIVIDGPVQFGVSRQYQIFADCYSHDSIFVDYVAALDWLKQQ